MELSDLYEVKFCSCSTLNDIIVRWLFCLSTVVKVWKVMWTVKTRQVTNCVLTRSSLLGKTIPSPWKSLDEGKQPICSGIEEWIWNLLVGLWEKCYKWNCKVWWKIGWKVKLKIEIMVVSMKEHKTENNVVLRSFIDKSGIVGKGKFSTFICIFSCHK